MTTTTEANRTTGTLAIATGVIAITALASLAVFFAGIGIFGPLNDLGNGLAGILSGVLAWRLGGGAGGRLGTWVGIAGAAVVAIGSVLILTGTTGFFLAGLVSSTGFAVVGLWLLALNTGARSDGRWPRGIATLGIVAGVLMLAGFATLPGILEGLDDMGAVPWYVWLGFVGWIGAFTVYPAWAIRLGRFLRSGGA